MRRTHVKFVGKSQLIKIEVELPDPGLAAATANAIAQGFIDSQFDNNLRSSQTNTSWMNSRLIELRNNLRSAENKLQAYREAQGLVDVGGVGGVATISANELEMTGNRMIDARRNLAEAESRFRQVQTLSNGNLSKLSSVPAVLSNPLVQKNSRRNRPRLKPRSKNCPGAMVQNTRLWPPRAPSCVRPPTACACRFDRWWLASNRITS